MYQIVLCDDDKKDREIILSLLEKIMNEEDIPFSVNQFESAGELMAEKKESGSWDLLILDILMDGKNGIELAEELRGMGDQTDIIFVTVSPEFALAGYRSWPVSYLLKPLTEEAFREVMKRSLKKISKEPALIFNMRKGGLLNIKLKDIFYIEVFGEELVVHDETGGYSCSGTMKDICAMLPQSEFYRCHRSFVVNLSSVNRIKRYEYTLTNGQTVSIAKGSWQEAKRRWMDFHISGGI